MKNYIQTTEVFQRLQTYNLMALYKYAYYYYYYYIPRFVQCQFSVLPHHFGRTPDGHFRRLARDVISIPKTLGHCTAFQFGLNTRKLF